MIIIITLSNDGSSGEVINWIKKYSFEKVLRINVDKDIVKLIRYNAINKQFIIQLNNEENYNLFDCKAFWYRKGGRLLRHSIKKTDIEEHNILTDLNSAAIIECDIINSFMYNFLEKKSIFSIGKQSNATPNKLNVLEVAKSIGIKVPDTFLYSLKEDVIAKSKECKLITKAASDGIYIFKNDYSYYTYTELMDKNNLEKLPDSFSPSLFQSNIDKKYEVRTFFLGENYYSMAILSQNSQQTKIDFRKYDHKIPNRKIPYTLPAEITKLLKKLMKKLELNTGSIDLIVDKNNEYFFLEVNPVGQFGMVSYPCNYNLEKKIALSLINKRYV